jgi:hypothetical protein
MTLSFFELYLTSPNVSQPTNLDIWDTWSRASPDDDVRVPNILMTNSRVLGMADERWALNSLREPAYELRNV